MFSIPELSWLYNNPMFTPRVHAGKWQTYRIKIEKTTLFIFEHLTHAWKIHSRGFYSNNRWNAPVPSFKWKHCIKTFQFWIQKSVSDGDFLFTFIVYHMADKDKSDLVMISNESETDSNPRKRQGTLVIVYKINKWLHNFKWVCSSRTTYIGGNT